MYREHRVKYEFGKDAAQSEIKSYGEDYKPGTYYFETPKGEKSVFALTQRRAVDYIRRAYPWWTIVEPSRYEQA